MNIRSASSDTPPARRGRLTRLRHFSSQHRIGFSASAVPCAGAGWLLRRILSQCLPKVLLLDRFRAQVALRRLLPSSRLGCTPHQSLSTSMLRLLSDLADPSVQPWVFPMTRYGRPTVFGGPPLLTGNPDPLRSNCAFTQYGSLALAGSCLAV